MYFLTNLYFLTFLVNQDLTTKEVLYIIYKVSVTNLSKRRSYEMYCKNLIEETKRNTKNVWQTIKKLAPKPPYFAHTLISPTLKN